MAVRVRKAASKKPTIGYSAAQGIQYEMAKEYNTTVPIERIIKETRDLAEVDQTRLVKAFAGYVKSTPAAYFSWSRFRDTWGSWLEKVEEMSAEDAYKAIAASPSGYTPNGGSIWRHEDIRKNVSEKAARTFTAIGGNAAFNSDAVYAKRIFIKEYNK